MRAIWILGGALLAVVALSYAWWLIGMIVAFGYPDWFKVGIDLTVCSIAVIAGGVLIWKGCRKPKT
jgi:hypothetical protein